MLCPEGRVAASRDEVFKCTRGSELQTVLAFVDLKHDVQHQAHLGAAWLEDDRKALQSVEA